MRLRCTGHSYGARNPRANAAAIGFRAQRLYFKPVVSRARIATQKLGQAIYGVHHHVDIAVVIEVAKCAPTTGIRSRDARSSQVGDFLKSAISQITVKQLALRVSRLGFELLDFGVHVPIADQNIGPAVVVEIEESASPAEVLRVRAEAGGESHVFKIRTAQVVIERRRVAGKIGFHDIEISVEIIVCRRNSHARLWLAVGTKRTSSYDRDILELAVFLVLIKRARR